MHDKTLKIFFKYPHLIMLTIASKFFMLLSVGTMMAGFANKMWFTVSFISGGIWALLIFLTMIFALKEMKKLALKIEEERGKA